jgi:hypothetical protein
LRLIRLEAIFVALQQKYVKFLLAQTKIKDFRAAFRVIAGETSHKTPATTWAILQTG